MMIITQAKKMSLSLFELNEFTVQDFIDYAREYNKSKKATRRKATQADIDAAFG